jgi:peptidoglycan/xylan/chitin deacetylase (PgdA/CDA1 family)
MGGEPLVGLRVDIDAIGDIEATPRLLDMLQDYNIKATFFVAMGPDRTGQNFFKYLARPWALTKVKPLRRFGLKTLIQGLANSPSMIEEYEDILKETKKKNEIGLHGYDHLTWVNGITKQSREEIKIAIEKGKRGFEKVFGEAPSSFASPGFKTSTAYLSVLEEYNFRYSSDFIGEEPFYPVINGTKAKTLQVPISMKSFGELAMKGISNKGILKIFQQRYEEGIRTRKFFTFYIHPSYEAALNARLLNHAIEKLTHDGRAIICPFDQIAEEWRIKNEDTSDI